MRQRGFGGGGSGGGGGVTSLAGTTHQIIVSSATGGVTVSTPQDIDTTSNPTFTTVVLTGTASLLAGTGSSLTGQLKLKNATNNNVLTLQPGATASNLTLNLPTADGSAGQVLTTNGSGSLGFTTASGGGSPGGADTNVQFNDAGALGGTASFTFNKSTSELVIKGTSGEVWLDSSSEGLIVNKRTAAVVNAILNLQYQGGSVFSVDASGQVNPTSNIVWASQTTFISWGGAPKLTGTAAGVLISDYCIQQAGTRARTATAPTNATATMSNLSDLSLTLKASRKYTGRVVFLAKDSTGADGLQFDFGGGSATFSAFQATAEEAPIGATLGTTNATTLTTALTNTVVATSDVVYAYNLTMVVGAAGAGTFIPRFAQNSHSAGTATVEVGSYIWLEDTP